MRVLSLLLVAAGLSHAFLVLPGSNGQIQSRRNWRLGSTPEDKPLIPSTRKTSVDDVVRVAQEYASRVTTGLSDLDSDKTQAQLTDWSSAVFSNVVRGFNLDVKGELWALAPPALLLVVLYGHVPLVGPVAEVLAGPGLLVLGVLFVIAGFVELGDNLSPWPQPISNSEFKTQGIYSLVRHPIYSGLLLFSLGLSVTTAEFERFLVTIALFLVLEKKVEFEEKYMVEKHEAYKSYQEETVKYFPFIY